jgi:hypothetical protein
MIAVLLKSGYHAAEATEGATQCAKPYTSDDLSDFDWEWLVRGRHVMCLAVPCGIAMYDITHSYLLDGLVCFGLSVS